MVKFLLCVIMIGQGLLQDALLSRGTCVSQRVPASHTLVGIYSNSLGNTMYPTPSKPT